jgi:hypothetical protein
MQKYHTCCNGGELASISRPCILFNAEGYSVFQEGVNFVVALSSQSIHGLHVHVSRWSEVSLSTDETNVLLLEGLILQKHRWTIRLKESTAE